jgi:hypothetical protein
MLFLRQFPEDDVGFSGSSCAISSGFSELKGMFGWHENTRIVVLRIRIVTV